MRSYVEYLQLLAADGGCLGQYDLELLSGALLDGGVPDVELGAFLTLLRGRAASGRMLCALLAALDTRVTRWRGVADATPVVIGCYGGADDQPNLAPLLALLIARFEVPVLMHGPLHAERGVSTALVLRELGVMPCVHKQQVAEELATRRLAFLPDTALAPGLASLHALRPRLGPIPLLFTGARLVDPFDCGALVIAGADDDHELDLMRFALGTNGAHALLLRAAGIEVFTHAASRTRIEHWNAGARQVLFDDDAHAASRPAGLPVALDPRGTATWVREAYEGARAVPTAILNQLAACLYAVGYCDDFNQAKALAALASTRRHVA